MPTSHRHYHNGRYLVTPLVAIVLLLSACAITPVAAPANGSQASSGAQSATQNPSNLPTIRVAMLPFISFAPFYIAQEEGFFTEQGLNVELVDIALQQDMIPSLASGQVDVSSGLLSAGIFNTVAQGGNIQIVADKGYVDPKGCPNLGLVARRGLIESGVGDNPQALQGLTLAVVRTTWLDYYAHKLFATAGVDMEQMHLTDIPSQAAP